MAKALIFAERRIGCSLDSAQKLGSSREALNDGFSIFSVFWLSL